MKTYVLDTNVLLQSPSSLFAFTDNTVVLPEAVLEELDKFKKERSEIGQAARSVIRALDALRDKGMLTSGVATPDGGFIRIECNHLGVQLPGSWEVGTHDNRILQVCKGLQDDNHKVILITKDIIMRIKAQVMGIDTQDYQNEQTPQPDHQYRGRRVLYISAASITKLNRQKYLALDKIKVYTEDGEELDISQLTINEFIALRTGESGKQSSLAIFDGNRLRSLRYSDSHPYGVTLRNAGQRFFIEALNLSVDEAPLVIAKGAAGTAKTFLSLAVGLEKVLRQESTREYRRILICRPNVHMDEHIGFLPGTEQEKISPLMRPIYDNLEILVDSNNNQRYSNEKELTSKVQYLFANGVITTEAIAYLRGRSIARHWLIIDEAQNLTPRQAKAIITRAGEGTKVILIGDPEQIDHPFLDARTNGLSFAAEHMKGSRYCYQLTFDLNESVRSPLAMDGAQRL